MKFISCFSGIEAASVASAKLGWEPVAFSEIDTFASSVLTHHFPRVPNLGDITKVNWRLYAGSVGLVCGGSPCQAFSVAGLRKSLEDPRGNLTLEFMRAVHDIKPKWVMWENVPGTFSATGNPFGCFVAGLAGYDSPIEHTGGKWASSGFLVAKDEESYSLAWRVLDAQYFGVPQRRRRIFLVGHLGRGSWWKSLEVLLERGGEGRDIEKGREARKEVAGNAGSGVDGLVMAHGQGGAEIREGQSPCLTCNHEAPILFEHHMQDSRIKGPLDVSPQLNAKAGTGGGNLPLVMQREPVVAFNWQSGGDCRLEPREDQANTLQRCQTQAVAFAQNQEGELRTSEIANTVTTTGNASARGTGKLLSGSVVRRLTPTECERLQGFPDNWTRIPYRGKPAEACPDGPRYKALGNSWAVPCARWIFERINKVDKL